MEQEAVPRGSEVQAGEWLTRVADEVHFVGAGEGPPDFVVSFGGKEVAVEVTRMLDGEGWQPVQRKAFQHELESVIMSVREETGAPRWHVGCEYDPREPRPPKPRGEWVELVRETLRTPGPGGEIQLVPGNSRAGRGVRVVYMPAGNDGSFSRVEEDIGIIGTGTASTRIAACVTEKARKVRAGRRAQEYANWWLVLVEEVVLVHAGLDEEWSNLKESIRGCDGLDQWNKVVMLSRNTGEFTVVHERTGEPSLVS